jgi:hypothetical protein
MDSNEELLLVFQKAIEEKLPGMQVDAFRKHIDEAKKIKAEFADLKVVHQQLVIANKATVAELADLKSLKLESETIAQRKSTLEFDTLKFSVEKQVKEAQLTAEKEKVCLIQSLVNSVFRNIETRESILGNIPTKYQSRDSYGNVNEQICQTPAQVDQSKVQV